MITSRCLPAGRAGLRGFGPLAFQGSILCSTPFNPRAGSEKTTSIATSLLKKAQTSPIDTKKPNANFEFFRINGQKPVLSLEAFLILNQYMMGKISYKDALTERNKLPTEKQSCLLSLLVQAEIENRPDSSKLMSVSSNNWNYQMILYLPRYSKYHDYHTNAVIGSMAVGLLGLAGAITCFTQWQSAF
ncbi:MAG: hypothetical protein ACOYK9_06825 [Chlamydiia bacterium]